MHQKDGASTNTSLWCEKKMEANTKLKFYIKIKTLLFKFTKHIDVLNKFASVILNFFKNLLLIMTFSIKIKNVSAVNHCCKYCKFNTLLQSWTKRTRIVLSKWSNDKLTLIITIWVHVLYILQMLLQFAFICFKFSNLSRSAWNLTLISTSFSMKSLLKEEKKQFSLS